MLESGRSRAQLVATSPHYAVTRGRGDGSYTKTYRYRHDVARAAVSARLDTLSRLSTRLSALPKMSWTMDPSGITVRQQIVSRGSLASAIEEALETLASDLDAMHAEGQVHGDLNRKNVIETPTGFRMVDIEPILEIPCGFGYRLRTTLPYLHEDDRISGRISAKSDRLGFGCFAMWRIGAVCSPARAATSLHSLARDHTSASMMRRIYGSPSGGAGLTQPGARSP
jgi:hypothetical protein